MRSVFLIPWMIVVLINLHLSKNIYTPTPPPVDRTALTSLDLAVRCRDVSPQFPNWSFSAAPSGILIKQSLKLWSTFFRSHVSISFRNSKPADKKKEKKRKKKAWWGEHVRGGTAWKRDWAKRGDGREYRETDRCHVLVTRCEGRGSRLLTFQANDHHSLCPGSSPWRDQLF